jgi:hypothetical protein
MIYGTHIENSGDGNVLGDAMWTDSGTVAFHCSVADDRWRGRPLLRLAHRTVRCYTGQSGEL